MGHIVTDAPPDPDTDERDPANWCGLVWRIVRTAIESNANLLRVSILILLVCGALWLIASARK
jgi:hypothetical protein